MKTRIICKTLAVAVIILFLGLAVQPSVAVQPEEEMDESTFGLCILLVWTYWTIGGGIPDSFVKLKCEDLDSGFIRNRTSGLFGLHLFIGLKKGHTYRITAIEFDKSVVIEILNVWNFIGIETIDHGVYV